MALNVFGVDLGTASEIAKVAIPAIAVGGAAWAWGQRTYDYLLNREFDHWLVSVTTTTAKDENGFRRLVLDNLGSPEKFDDAVRGRHVRARMTAVAKRCTWDPERRFLIDRLSEQAEMLHTVRNTLSGFWEDGVRAMMSEAAISTDTYFFSVTGADAAVGAKKKYRIIVMRTSDMRTVLEHPKDKWLYTDASHSVRLETCRIMAQAWMENGAHEDWENQTDPVACGSIRVDGMTCPIVGWLRAYTPL